MICRSVKSTSGWKRFIHGCEAASRLSAALCRPGSFVYCVQQHLCNEHIFILDRNIPL